MTCAVPFDYLFFGFMLILLMSGMGVIFWAASKLMKINREDERPINKAAQPPTNQTSSQSETPLDSHPAKSAQSQIGNAKTMLDTRSDR